MADAIYTAAQDVVLASYGAGATYVPVAGTGPIPLLAVARPEPDEVADFPGLVFGAERPGWAVMLRQTDLPARPVAGDRLTFAFGTVQLRGVRAHARGYWWLTTGFMVEPDVSVSDVAVMIPPYLLGAGVLEL